MVCCSLFALCRRDSTISCTSCILYCTWVTQNLCTGQVKEWWPAVPVLSLWQPVAFHSLRRMAALKVPCSINSCIVQLSRLASPWNSAPTSKASMSRKTLNNHWDRRHPCLPAATQISLSVSLLLSPCFTILIQGYHTFTSLPNTPYLANVFHKPSHHLVS